MDKASGAGVGLTLGETRHSKPIGVQLEPALEASR